MPTTRKLVGRIEKPDGSPWINAKGTIKLENGSYTSDVQFPQYLIKYNTNEDGYLKRPESTDLGLTLWCNEEGEINSWYVLTLPDGKQLKFTIPVGTSDIELSPLRSNGVTPTDPSYDSILEYIENYIDNLVIPGNEQYQKLAIAANQTTWNLNSVPTQPQKSRVYVNGAKQVYGIDYTINSAVLSWVSALKLLSTFTFEVYYL